MFAAAAAMVLVLMVFGDNRLKLVTLAGIPVVVLFFKVAGLYDREQLRLMRSTLDEAPALVQVAGLYALTIAILQPHVVAGHLWGGQIAALWLTSFIAILAVRLSARWVSGRASAIERCLVIGDVVLARRIRENRSHDNIVLIALTGWGQTDDRNRTQAAGFDLHIVSLEDREARE